MGTYPLIYALLDLERFIAGVPQLRPWAFGGGPERMGGYHHWAPDLRRWSLAESEATIRGDLVWMGERVALPGVEVDDPRVVSFALGGRSDGWPSLSVEVPEVDQAPLDPPWRDRVLLAELTFEGAKYEGWLPAQHHAHPAALAFLSAVQPVHALVTLDTMVASQADDHEYFRQLWHQSSESLFLGPEVLRCLPNSLLAAIEADAVMPVRRLGAGLWFTVPGNTRLYGNADWDWQTWSSDNPGQAAYTRQWQLQLAAALATITFDDLFPGLP